jgi:hypothetical protein
MWTFLFLHYAKMAFSARSLGLVQTSSGDLLFQLLTPISLMICALIQINFFHAGIMEITQFWEDEVYGLKLRFLMTKLKLFYGKMNYLENTWIISDKIGTNDHSAQSPKERVKHFLGIVEAKCRQMLSYRQNLWNIGWRLLEIHIGKLIAALMIYISINEV